MILYGGTENSIFDPIIELTSDPGVLSFDVAAVRANAREVRAVAASPLAHFLLAVVSITT